MHDLRIVATFFNDFNELQVEGAAIAGSEPPTFRRQIAAMATVVEVAFDGGIGSGYRRGDLGGRLAGIGERECSGKCRSTRLQHVSDH